MGVKTIKDNNIIYFVDDSIKTIEILVFLTIDDKFTINDMIQVFNSKTISLYKSYDIIDISCVIITNSRKWW
jgi:hypothetical protein